MAWHARLSIDYTLEAHRCVARHRHSGPLRVLQSLYPEGSGICHNVLVHPPGGLAGGDVLDVQVQVVAGAHGLVTTPGATRFYRCEGEASVQRTHLQLAAGARLEWLPLETIYYSGCLAENRLEMTLAAGAEAMGWDIAALGLPHADMPFAKGRVLQHLALEDVWLERGQIDAADTRLLQSPLGLAGRSCLATLFFAAGEPLPRTRREAALDAARAVIDAHSLRELSGVTQPHPRVLALRALAPVAEPVLDLFQQVRAVWRQSLWELEAPAPRIWAM